MLIDTEVIARLAAAAVLGAAVGLEREADDQPAGLRTHMTVALGAALFGIISTLGFEEFKTTQQAVNIQYDVTRVASTVVTAVGFLGAGMIFRRGTAVHHLTTAASIWVVAAIGLACGVGDGGSAFVATVALLVSLVVLRPVRDVLRRKLQKDREPLRVELVEDASHEPVLEHFRSLGGIRLHGLGIEKSDGRLVIAASVEADADVPLRERLSAISLRDDVRSLQVGGSTDAT